MLFLLQVCSLFFFSNKKKEHFWSLYRNARFPQIFYHGGLLVIGSLLAWYFEKLTLPFELFSVLAYVLLSLSITLAWLTSVIVNDLYDTEIDALTNQKRPLIESTIPRELYTTYGFFFFFFSLLFAGLVSGQALLLVCMYQIIAYSYSAPPLRLKRFPFLATLLAAFTNIIILSIGYSTLSEHHSIQTLPLGIVLYLLVAFTFSLILKDFKDIEGDKKDHVFTIPVLLGETSAKLFMGTVLFLIFACSPLLLNQKSIMPISLLFASLAFWMVQKGSAQEENFFYYQRFSLLFFLLTFCYGLFITLSFLF